MTRPPKALRLANTEASDALAHARTVLEEEARAIRLVSTSLDQNFNALVEIIAGLPDSARLITSGIGKAGFIAMKVSASFASTGTPSLFVHPAEAVHGDLGRITRSDVVLVFSNSGDTPEIVRFVAGLLKIGCKIVALTANAHSYLARHAQQSILIPLIAEPGVLGLAPTASTTAMLALGDALVLSVLRRRDFTKDDFALRHPGGTLGRTLMPVGEVMRSGDQLCVVRETLACRDVLHRITLTKGRPGAASIIDSAGVLIGVFTDGDLRRCLEKDEHFLDLPVHAVMTRNPKTVTSDLLAEQALKILNTYQIDQVIVVDDRNKPIGLLDIQDLVQAS